MGLTDKPITIALLVAGLFLQLTATIAEARGNLLVTSAWIRNAPPGAPVLAGYMTIRNHSLQDVTLVGAESPVFENAMIHHSEQANGVVGMRHLPRVDIKANAILVFQPGGYHLMLMQPKRPLRTGDRVPITLRFADGSRQEAVYEVREQMAAREDAGTAGAKRRVLSNDHTMK